MADDSTQDDILDIIEERNREREENDFSQWCENLAALPTDFEPQLKEGLIADIELQPLRWLSLGIELIQSSKGIGRIQLTDGRQGPHLDSFLSYPVFQIGAEVFLKGMWLCQYKDCRRLGDDAYIAPARRQKYAMSLGRSGLGHDLIHIVRAIHDIPQYQSDALSVRFLRIVEGAVRTFYFPAYKADARRDRWANSRYPKRFYNDRTREAYADAFKRYPSQTMILKLFQQMEAHVDSLWNLRVELSAGGVSNSSDANRNG